MTLTIFKNDDFENIGFSVTDRGNHVYHYGIQSGWSKDVALTTQNLAIYHNIMLSEQKIKDLKNFRMLFFTIAKDNAWYKNQPVRMGELEKQIEMEENHIKSTLKSLC